MINLQGAMLLFHLPAAAKGLIYRCLWLQVLERSSLPRPLQWQLSPLHDGQARQRRQQLQQHLLQPAHRLCLQRPPQVGIPCRRIVSTLQQLVLQNLSRCDGLHTHAAKKKGLLRSLSKSLRRKSSKSGTTPSLASDDSASTIAGETTVCVQHLVHAATAPEHTTPAADPCAPICCRLHQ